MLVWNVPFSQNLVVGRWAGGGFECAPSITLLQKGDVNGSAAHALFKWLKNAMPIPFDGEGIDSKDNGYS